MTPLTDKWLIKPCPKCGSDNTSYGWSAPGRDGSMNTGDAECHDCGFLVIAPTQNDAVAQWNMGRCP